MATWIYYFPDPSVMTWACLESSVKLTTWLEGSIESVNHLWAANHNIILYSSHISTSYVYSKLYSTYN